MSYNVLDLKAEVEAELAEGYEPRRLAKKAFRIYSEQGRDLEPALDTAVMRLTRKFHQASPRQSRRRQLVDFLFDRLTVALVAGQNRFALA